jgi:hypothetical protein
MEIWANMSAIFATHTYSGAHVQNYDILAGLWQAGSFLEVDHSRQPWSVASSLPSFTSSFQAHFLQPNLAAMQNFSPC